MNRWEGFTYEELKAIKDALDDVDDDLESFLSEEINDELSRWKDDE